MWDHGDTVLLLRVVAVAAGIVGAAAVIGLAVRVFVLASGVF